MTSSPLKQGLAQSVRQLVEETERLLKAAADNGNDRFDGVRHQVADRVRMTRSQLEALERVAMREARRAARQTDRAIGAHPYRAIGVAAVAGLLIGLLASRR